MSQFNFLYYLKQLDNTKSELISKTEDFKVLKKENRKRRKIIEAYQDMINAGATGLHPVCDVYMYVLVHYDLYNNFI